MTTFKSTHQFDPQHPENFFIKRKSLVPIIHEMRKSEGGRCRLAIRSEGDRPELLFSLPSLSDEVIEALARDFPCLCNVISPDYMHLVTQFIWSQEDVYIAIMAEEFFYPLIDSERGGFGIAFFNQRVGCYSHGRLTASDKEWLSDEMNACSSHSMNYRPDRSWDEELLEKHRGLDDAPPNPNSFPLRVNPVEA